MPGAGYKTLFVSIAGQDPPPAVLARLSGSPSPLVLPASSGVITKPDERNVPILIDRASGRSGHLVYVHKLQWEIRPSLIGRVRVQVDGPFSQHVYGLMRTDGKWHVEMTGEASKVGSPPNFIWPDGW